MSAPDVRERQVTAEEVLAALHAGEAPTPLTRAPTPRAFPVAALGEPVAAMVTAVAVATQTDPGIAGTLALGALAAAAGGRLRVRARAGWLEPVNLYVCPAAAPGTRKSAVFRAMLDPLREAERTMAEGSREALTRALTARDVAERIAEAARAAAGKAATGKAPLSPDDRKTLLEKAQAEAEAAEQVVVPVIPRLLADDATPEAMTSLIVEQGGRLAVVSAEGGIFGTLAGRYSKVPSLDVVLKGHAGDTMRVDRKGRAPEYVEAPALTLVLTVQPAVLAEVGRNRDFEGRGLLARLLCCLPPSTVGRREIAPPPVPTGVQESYGALVTALAVALAALDEPATVQLDREAAAVLHAAETEHEARLGPAGGLAPVVEWASKAMGAAVRVAGLLHLVQHRGLDQDRPISATTMRAALEVMGYFTDHALAVAEVMGADDGLEDARTVLRHAQAHPGAATARGISQRDLHVALPRSRFPTIDVVRSALEILREEGWAAELPAQKPAGSGGRPPSPRWCIRTANVDTQPTEPTQPPPSEVLWVLWVVCRPSEVWHRYERATPRAGPDALPAVATTTGAVGPPARAGGAERARVPARLARRGRTGQAAPVPDLQTAPGRRARPRPARDDHR